MISITCLKPQCIELGAVCLFLSRHRIQCILLSNSFPFRKNLIQYSNFSQHLRLYIWRALWLFSDAKRWKRRIWSERSTRHSMSDTKIFRPVVQFEFEWDERCNRGKTIFIIFLTITDFDSWPTFFEEGGKHLAFLTPVILNSWFSNCCRIFIREGEKEVVRWGVCATDYRCNVTII